MEAAWLLAAVVSVAYMRAGAIAPRSESNVLLPTAQSEVDPTRWRGGIWGRDGNRRRFRDVEGEVTDILSKF